MDNRHTLAIAAEFLKSRKGPRGIAGLLRELDRTMSFPWERGNRLRRFAEMIHAYRDGEPIASIKNRYGCSRPHDHSLRTDHGTAEEGQGLRCGSKDQSDQALQGRAAHRGDSQALRCLPGLRLSHGHGGAHQSEGRQEETPWRIATTSTSSARS